MSMYGLDSSPSSNGSAMRVFGVRDIDMTCNWNNACPENYDLGDSPETYLAQQKLLHPVTTDEHVRVHPDELNSGQRCIYDYSIDTLSQMENSSDGMGRPVNSIIMGTAGVGKSFLIR